MAAAPQLSPRDQAILRDLDRVRLLSGRQLERLHFADLATANARSSARRRSLGRLVDYRLVVTLPRRVGGVRSGSAGLVYSLDSAARRHPEMWDQLPPAAGRVRRPWPIGWPFVAHTLDVTELYVRLRERERATGCRLRRFDAEPACWYVSGAGTIKPDAYVVYDDGPWEQHRWIEVDRATESGPTVRRKLAAYLELLAIGDGGPAGVLPSLLLTVPDERRKLQLGQLLTSLDAPSGYVTIQLFDDVARPTERPP